MTDQPQPTPVAKPSFWDALKKKIDDNRTIAGAIGGAAAGTVVPGIGTIIGAIVGAGIGFASSHEKKEGK